MRCFGLYVAITIARWGVYGLHLWAESAFHGKEVEFDHLISDHIVLGASIVAILQLECAYMLDILFKSSSKDKENNKRAEHWPSVVVLCCALAIALLLFACTCGDMYYTALYFHPRAQSTFALLIGSLFQMGSSLWLRQKI